MIQRRPYRNLKMFLTKSGTTQAALARRLGVDVSHISHILAGRKLPSGPLAMKLAREANIPLASLFERAS
jgi:transcriptional regulator with XRE-family HTH domain